MMKHKHNPINQYSKQWFDSFYHNVPTDWTLRDVEGITSRLPLSQFPKILDLGSGFGRIAGPLAERGYLVTGIDNYPPAIKKASIRFPSAQFLTLNLLDLDVLPFHNFDATLTLWHSFGYFSELENEEVLRLIRRRLRNGGLAIFDLFNPTYVAEHTGTQPTRGAHVFNAETIINGNRLTSVITYTNGKSDRIDFQIYSVQEFTQICKAVGLETIETLVHWNLVEQVDDQAVRFQLICKAIEQP